MSTQLAAVLAIPCGRRASSLVAALVLGAAASTQSMARQTRVDPAPSQPRSSAPAVPGKSPIAIYSEVPGRVTIQEIARHCEHVKKGDVICRLDDSRFQEEAARQRIAVTRAEQAVHDAEARKSVAELSNGEFSEGTASEIELELQGKLEAIRLNRAQVERSIRVLASRVPATDPVLVEMRKGLEGVRQDERKARQDLELAQSIHKRADETHDIKMRQTDRAIDLLQKQLESEQEKLDKLGQAIARCTIEAPCAGIVEIVSPTRADREPAAAGVVLIRHQLFMRLIPDDPQPQPEPAPGVEGKSAQPPGSGRLQPPPGQPAPRLSHEAPARE